MRSKRTPIAATIQLLRRCQKARATGYPVAFCTDPTWLVHMAINRRAGWPDDPSHWRGSAMPVNGKYPRLAEGIRYNHLRQIAYRVNTPRLIVRDGELGEWRRLIQKRLPHRIHDSYSD